MLTNEKRSDESEMEGRRKKLKEDEGSKASEALQTLTLNPILEAVYAYMHIYIYVFMYVCILCMYVCM